MSNEAQSWVRDHSEAEPGSDYWVLMTIANEVGADGKNGWPGLKRIAWGARISVRTAQRSIKALEELGELVVETNAGGFENWRKDRRPNRYQVKCRYCGHLCGGHAGQTGRQSDTSSTERGDKSAERGDKNEQRGDIAVSSNPLINIPVINEKSEFQKNDNECSKCDHGWVEENNLVSPCENCSGTGRVLP